MEIEKYLTEDQMREIAIEEWRSMCREACNGSAERIISNISHDVVRQMVAEALGEGANTLIRNKAVKVIDELSAWAVFKSPDAWDRSASPAYTVLMNAVQANKDLVEAKVRQCIGQISKREALEVLKSGTIQINPSRAGVA